MYMGHLGIALGAKGVRPRISLLVLCLAATAPDLIGFAGAALGFPAAAGLWSHGGTAMVVYGLAFALLYFAFTRRKQESLLVGLVACSHVLADLITSHMALWRGGPAVGLHLYLHPRLDFAIEATIIAIGWWLYTLSLRRRRRSSIPALSILLLLLALQALLLFVNVS